MNKNLIFMLVSMAFIFSPLANASVEGTVKWSGKAPKMRSINMDKEPVCVKKYGKGGPKSEALVLGSGNTMANVIVHVKSGLPAKGKYTAPKDVLVIDQDGCSYKPHVFALMQKQKIKFKNSDGVLHNVHALPKVNRPFNLSMPATMTESKAKKFKTAEGPFIIKCDVHPWMRSYVGVFSHPFFAVTSKDGKFSIADLPDGSYELEAWHEKAGTRTAKVTVKGGKASPVSFSFSK